MRIPTNMKRPKYDFEKKNTAIIRASQNRTGGSFGTNAYRLTLRSKRLLTFSMNLNLKKRMYFSVLTVESTVRTQSCVFRAPRLLSCLLRQARHILDRFCFGLRPIQAPNKPAGYHSGSAKTISNQDISSHFSRTTFRVTSFHLF